jgi:multidrug efflux pump
MLGETTLAMLYVPLFFYIFESLSERLRDRKKRRAAPAKAGHAPLPAPEGGV